MKVSNCFRNTAIGLSTALLMSPALILTAIKPVEARKPWTQQWQSTIRETDGDFKKLCGTGSAYRVSCLNDVCKERHGGNAFHRQDDKGIHCWKRVWVGF